MYTQKKIHLKYILIILAGKKFYIVAFSLK